MRKKGLRQYYHGDFPPWNTDEEEINAIMAEKGITETYEEHILSRFSEKYNIRIDEYENITDIVDLSELLVIAEENGLNIKLKNVLEESYTRDIKQVVSIIKALIES